MQVHGDTVPHFYVRENGGCLVFSTNSYGVVHVCTQRQCNVIYMKQNKALHVYIHMYVVVPYGL
jgi:hypothetical protein